MIEINNLTKEKIDERFLKKVAKIVLKGESMEKENLSIVLVDENKIRELNKKYRKKNKPTDVLSFGNIQDSKYQIPNSSINEIVICPQIVKKNAKKFATGYNKELARVLIHGILHILGYEHEKNKKEADKMKNKEEYYLSKIWQKFATLLV